MSMITPEEISRHAHLLYLARGCKDGYDLEEFASGGRKLECCSTGLPSVARSVVSKPVCVRSARPVANAAPSRFGLDAWSVRISQPVSRSHTARVRSDDRLSTTAVTSFRYRTIENRHTKSIGQTVNIPPRRSPIVSVMFLDVARLWNLNLFDSST